MTKRSRFTIGLLLVTLIVVLLSMLQSGGLQGSLARLAEERQTRSQFRAACHNEPGSTWRARGENGPTCELAEIGTVESLAELHELKGEYEICMNDGALWSLQAQECLYEADEMSYEEIEMPIEEVIE